MPLADKTNSNQTVSSGSLNSAASKKRKAPPNTGMDKTTAGDIGEEAETTANMADAAKKSITMATTTTESTPKMTRKSLLNSLLPKTPLTLKNFQPQQKNNLNTMSTAAGAPRRPKKVSFDSESQRKVFDITESTNANAMLVEKVATKAANNEGSEPAPKNVLDSTINRPPKEVLERWNEAWDNRK